ncbi:MAG TPA: TetR/AcrR family transcriptional regulator [Thermomicrobiales bacterium]|nr:TetR/AcrR family transcriptional regulator [Thermomicrobiales bacterium]
MKHEDPRVQRSRAAILDAAVSLFVEGGIRAVTVDEVALRSGVAKTTIYRHWPNREALLMDVFRRFDHRFSAPQDGQTPEAYLRVVMEELVATMAEERWRQALPALLDVARRVDEFAELHASMPPGGGSISRAIVRLIEAGVLPPVDPGEVLAQLVGPLTMAAMFAPAALNDAFANGIVDRLIAGYAATMGGIAPVRESPVITDPTDGRGTAA